MLASVLMRLITESKSSGIVVNERYIGRLGGAVRVLSRQQSI